MLTVSAGNEIVTMHVAGPGGADAHYEAETIDHP